MKILISGLIICLFSFSSCIKESMTTTIATLKNQSGVSINIIAYVNGTQLNNIVEIIANSSFEISHENNFGISNNAGFSSKYLSGMDSVKVVFNDSFIVTHYRKIADSLHPKSLGNNNNRNIFNYLNYVYSFVDKSKHSRLTTYIYTFTEADYNFAKD